MHFTLRELQRIVTAPRFWLAILASGFLLGLLGPLGTYEAMTLPLRIAYWVATAVTTYLAADAVITFLSVLRTGERQGGAFAFAAYGLAAGVAVAFLVWSINASVFGVGQSINLVPLLGYVMAITAVVAVLMRVLVYGEAVSPSETATQTADAPVQPQASLVRPRILDRLPVAARGRLSHMSMQDHYVDIRTDRGGALVLMRLADAIAETEGIQGMQIHRSHWVARDAVAGSQRKDGRLFLKMADGTELPVARPYLQVVREAALV